ncbi:hypothetical protein [Reinekea sp.]|jgi:hypothetical protein|uniref:hypothetical protein n=1 Tax=Reinekea sp. TaxID=1970455 RepID=UPI002A830A05|nr:hypothetical protein [Reinekea sp.]
MNPTIVYQLILAKQGSKPKRVIRDIGLTWLIATAVVLLANIGSAGSFDNYSGIFGVALLFIAQLELGNHTFDEYKQERSATQWLMLPASPFEKWLSSFLTSFLVVLVFLLVVSLSTLAANLLVSLFGWGNLVPIFNPFGQDALVLLKLYVWIHPLLFFSAIYFKKRPIIKSFGALSLLLIVWLFYTGSLVNLMLGDQISASMLEFPSQMRSAEVLRIGNFLEIRGEDVQFNSTRFTQFASTILTLLYFGFFWLMSFLRFKELEL